MLSYQRERYSDSFSALLSLPLQFRVNKVSVLCWRHQYFSVLSQLVPNAQIKCEAQPTPQGILYYSKNTGVLLADCGACFGNTFLPFSLTQKKKYMQCLTQAGPAGANVMLLRPGNEL